MTRSDPRSENELAQDLEDHLHRFEPYLLISPPRANSSVFATALGRNSGIRNYIHEPCGRFSYENLSIRSVLDALADLRPATLIKEMTFQMREERVAHAFLRGCRTPILFLVRSPLLTVESRVRLVLTDILNAPGTATGDRETLETAIARRRYEDLDGFVTESAFPIYRTGWEDLEAQLSACREQEIDHLVIETSDFRRHPEAMLERLCPRLGLHYEPEMLSWPAGDTRLSGALDRHQAWYRRVKRSTGIEPPDPYVPPAEHLPARFRAHLPEAMAIYRSALSDPDSVVRITA